MQHKQEEARERKKFARSSLTASSFAGQRGARLSVRNGRTNLNLSRGSRREAEPARRTEDSEEESSDRSTTTTSRMKMVAAGSARLGSVVDAVSCGGEGQHAPGPRISREEKRSRLMLLLALALALLCLARRATASGMMLLQPGGLAPEQHHRQGLMMAADGRELQSFPSVTNSTILFLHVFKVGTARVYRAAGVV